MTKRQNELDKVITPKTQLDKLTKELLDTMNLPATSLFDDELRVSVYWVSARRFVKKHCIR